MFTEADALAFQTKEWVPIPFISRTIPFGYKVDENDPEVLQPIILELEALKKAKHYLKMYSYREVARWLTSETGRSISHMGLKKRVESERRRADSARALQAFATRAEKARAKAEKLQNRLGAGDPLPTEEQ